VVGSTWHRLARLAATRDGPSGGSGGNARWAHEVLNVTQFSIAQPSKFTNMFFPIPKIHESFWGDKADNREQLSFLSIFQILMDFELKILETIQIWIWFEF
jgi:hypothetical protein